MILRAAVAWDSERAPDFFEGNTNDVQSGQSFEYYPQTSKIRHALVGNELVDHSDINGALPVGDAPIFILNLTLGFNRLRKNNCKTRQETFKFWDLVQLILEV